MDGTLRTADGRCVLRFERHLTHPVEKVWRAITEPGELRHWFPAEVEIEFHSGGKIRFTQGAAATTGEILELAPHRVFAFSWDADMLRFELHPDPGGCRLVFTHAFDDKYGASSFASGWHHCLDGLAVRLEGQTMDWPTGLGDLHERYVVDLGLDEGVLRETGGGYEVRFERQLIRPVEQVWDFLTGAAEPPAATDARATSATSSDRPPATRPQRGALPPVSFRNDQAPAGPVTVVEAPNVLEYAWLADDVEAGKVRWELAPGPGGARLVLTQSVPTTFADRVPAVLAAWHTHVELLAGWLRGEGRCWPEGRTEELTRHYASTRP
ncbi:SRPBCC family protein [Actinopolymorpha pittospori]